MTQRRKSWLLMAALAALLLVAGCVAPAAPAAEAPAADDAAASEASGEQTTITWAFWGDPPEVVVHEQVAAAFEAEHPEINIEIWHQPWGDYFTAIQALWASGDSAAIPDVAFLWPTPRYAAEGVLEPLDAFVESSGKSLDDYWPGLLESASYDGAVYGFPRDIEVNVLYYNKDIFDEAGVEYPTDSWTWDDFLAAAEALTVKDDSGNTTRYALGMEGGKWPKWVNQAGGSILDDLRNPSACTLTSEESLRGLQFFADLMDAGYAMRPADLGQAGGDAGVFASGQAAMIIQNTSRVSGFNDAGLNYDVAPVPTPADGKRWNGAGGAAWVMSSASDNKDEAWTFLEWLSGPAGQEIYLAAGQIFPSLQSVANSPAFMTDSAPANKQAIITEASASDVGGFGYFPEWGELDGSVLGPGLEVIWGGEATVADQVPVICEQVNAFLAENGLPN
ncbi:MAG: ABC transporter substrate-binding protein [Caldilineaceae bacterium]